LFLPPGFQLRDSSFTGTLQDIRTWRIDPGTGDSFSTRFNPNYRNFIFPPPA
jgi:hypothetical protein